MYLATVRLFSPVSVANELIAQYSNTWLSFAVAVWQRTSAVCICVVCLIEYKNEQP